VDVPGQQTDMLPPGMHEPNVGLHKTKQGRLSDLIDGRLNDERYTSHVYVYS
jgi:hypothetical protein